MKLISCYLKVGTAASQRFCPPNKGAEKFADEMLLCWAADGD